jgi:RNA polymerase sigma factor (sigma-70 family)
MPVMDVPTTSPTLLRLLGLPGSDEAWRTFVARYGPLIGARCRRAGLQPADADDVRAAVLAKLVEAMGEFRHDPARRFRGYIQRVVDNAIITHWRTLGRRPGWVGRGGDEVDALPEPMAGLGAELDEQVQERVDGLLRAVDQVRFEVGAEAWQAFWLTAVEGLSGAEAASRLGRSAAAVYMAKSRVLARLRAEPAKRPAERSNGTPDGA